MDIKILGTAAAEGWPALFCSCDACREARRRGGRNLRSRSSIVIDEMLKIDFPADTLYHSLRDGTDTSRLRYLFITHTHYDHCAPADLCWLAPLFTRRDGLPLLDVYANADVLARIRAAVTSDCRLQLHELAPSDSVEAGPYRVMAVRANHNVDRDPLNFVVRTGGKAVLYACDTGFYSEQTWLHLAGAAVDLVVVECTFGDQKQTSAAAHLGLGNIVEMRQRAVADGVARPSARWVLTHFSHICGLLHDELVARAEPDDLEIGYDGMSVVL